MKSKYLQKIFEANELAMKCQKINMGGASATIASYVTAYNDFSEVLEDLRNVIIQAKYIDGWEKNIKKFNKDPDFDKDNVLDSIKYHEEEMNKSFEKLRRFVNKRNKQGFGTNY